MISQKLTDELGKILEEDYDLKLSPEDLALFSNDLAEFFKVLFAKNNKEETDEL